MPDDRRGRSRRDRDVWLLQHRFAAVMVRDGGDEKKERAMLKRVTVALCVIAGSLMVAQAPAQAGPPTDATGDWDYITAVAGVREAGCNTFLTLIESDEFSGTISGESNPDLNTSEVVLHCNGSVSFHGRLYFDEVTVDGRTGSMVMLTQGRLAAGDLEWSGQWTVLSASGGLDGLHGTGSWWGPGAGGPGLPGELYYDGKVHFSP